MFRQICIFENLYSISFCPVKIKQIQKLIAKLQVNLELQPRTFPTPLQEKSLINEQSNLDRIHRRSMRKNCISLFIYNRKV